MAAKKPNWYIRLGALEALRHTYERPETDTLQLLGSIRRGPQIGALALTSDGQYIQIVGDHQTPLNAAQIKRALASATLAPTPHHAPSSPKLTAPFTAPVVVVKRRRTYIAPQTATPA